MGAISGHHQLLLGGAAGLDPYFSNVVSLLHMDGTNGGTSFPDVKGLTWTPGSMTTSTTQSKFGGSSMRCPGTSSLSCVNAALALGSGDWTIEGWVRADTISTSFQSIVVRSGHAIYITGSKLTWYEGGIQIQSSTLLSNTWYHFEVSRASGTIRLFVDGVKAATDFASATNYTSTRVDMGRNSSGTEVFTGYLDDVRTTIGVARHTANFTPPTAAYPDS